METIGIFEAKTKFTALCERVVKNGQPLVVSKRGRPMVMLAPLPISLQTERPDVLTAWRKWREPEAGAEFPEVRQFRGWNKGNPLEE